MLSKKSKYAIKALVAMAKKDASSNTPMRIIEIAESGSIPKKFLESILLELRKQHILGSKQGINGGYYFLKQASSISLTEIIRLMDGPIALIPCASLHFYEKCDDCVDETICGLRKVFTQLRDTSLQVLTNTSIADIVQQETAVR